MAKPEGHGGRDYPDYGVSKLPSATSYVADMSELAARVGSPNYFDRKGVQLFNETFDSGLADWYTTTNLAGSYARLRSDYTAFGPYAVELTCGGAVGASAVIQRSLPYPYISTLGLEYHVKNVIAGINNNFTLWLYTGTVYYQLSLRIDAIAGTFYYLGDGPAWHNIDISPHYTGTGSQFHIVKVRANVETGNWIEAMIDTDDFDISNVSLYSVANADPKRLRLYLTAINTTGASQTDIVDNIIITLDEPS